MTLKGWRSGHDLERMKVRSWPWKEIRRSGKFQQAVSCKWYRVGNMLQWEAFSSINNHTGTTHSGHVRFDLERMKVRSWPWKDIRRSGNFQQAVSCKWYRVGNMLQWEALSSIDNHTDTTHSGHVRFWHTTTLKGHGKGHLIFYSLYRGDGRD